MASNKPTWWQRLARGFLTSSAATQQGENKQEVENTEAYKNIKKRKQMLQQIMNNK